MKVNDSIIKHYRVNEIPIWDLKKIISLNEEYLKEKPNWFEIDGKMYYFKQRNDMRVFTEHFFSRYGREVIGLDTVEYTPACLRIATPTTASKDEKTHFGLISENFQTDENNYYLVSELLNSEISTMPSFGGYNLKSLLEYLKNTLTEEDYKKNKDFLIKLFIADAFTHQEDRNPNNIGFQIPKIKNVSYNKRLFGGSLSKIEDAKESIETVNGQIKIKGFTPSKVYDSERIFGFDHKNVNTYKTGDIWMPLFPYSEATTFKSKEEARNAQIELYDGYEPNLIELYSEHEKECKPLFEKIAYGDEEFKILEDFTNKDAPVRIEESDKETIENIIKEKKETVKRILKF